MNTQKESWKALQKDLGARQLAVLKQIKAQGKATLFEVAECLNWPAHCVSGRITELKTQGKIKDTGLRKINPSTGRQVTVYAIGKAA